MAKVRPGGWQLTRAGLVGVCGRFTICPNCLRCDAVVANMVVVIFVYSVLVAFDVVVVVCI